MSTLPFIEGFLFLLIYVSYTMKLSENQKRILKEELGVVIIFAFVVLYLYYTDSYDLTWIPLLLLFIILPLIRPWLYKGIWHKTISFIDKPSKIIS